MELVLQQLQADLRAFKRLKKAGQLPHQEEQRKEQTRDLADAWGSLQQQYWEHDEISVGLALVEEARAF